GHAAIDNPSEQGLGYWYLAGRHHSVTEKSPEDSPPGLAFTSTKKGVVVPAQPWLDGYAVEKGVIRQFVAMPLGSGYSAEAQITGREEHGGLQVIVYPMKRESYECVYPPPFLARPRGSMTFGRVAQDACMGLAPGGRMRQEIFDDPFEPGDWDTQHASRCFVHLANSMVWRAITGQEPPTVPPTAKEYTRAGLPWFEYYGADQVALEGSSILDKLKSVTQLAKQKGDVPLPENEPVTPQKVIQLRAALRKHQVREGEF
ncbi:MAG: hypothetical protein JSU87_09245, partial [Gemmatimonadota bacterium]